MILCDASALIAMINKGDANHQRCVDVLPQLSSPMSTTWSCFTETMHLLGRRGGWPAQKELWSYVVDDILRLHLNTPADHLRMAALMMQYRDIPMDLGDASLVVTAEVLDQVQIFTLDRDFCIYRRYGSQPFEMLP